MEEKRIFAPTLESLRQYETPDWYLDAKFGIYCHWNAYSASKSADNGWYARHMYEQGSGAYQDHLKNWGHPSQVGYKDVIKAWNPDKFDAAKWIALFQNAGAKYVMTMAVHHDNFDFWDSRYQPKWNSLHYGPKIDVCRAMREACLNAGLRWGARTHLARSYSWFQTNKGCDASGPYQGVPYDGNLAEYEDLYHEKTRPEQIGGEYNQIRHPLLPSDKWVALWQNRIIDLIDRYHPDHLYFDGAVPFMHDQGQAGLEVIAHFYNHNAAMHNGRNEGVMVIKEGRDHGFYYEGISSVVLERSREENIVYPARETEDSVGPWFYDGNPENYRSSQSLLHEMVDVVSKNCNFVLNVPPKPDGTFDEPCLKILSDFGTWLAKHEQAIYGTRPWGTFGEENVRFTTQQSPDKALKLFAILLDKPPGKVLLQSLRLCNASQIQAVRMNGESLRWECTPAGLEIAVPERLFDDVELAYVLEIHGSTSELPAAKISEQSVAAENAANQQKYGADGGGNVAL